MKHIIEDQIYDVGDKLYRVSKGQIFHIEITQVKQMELGHYVYTDNYGKTYFKRNLENKCFKDIRDAKQYIKMLENIVKKKKLLKKYEEKLNKKFKIENQTFIK